jgi:hypothetical protein
MVRRFLFALKLRAVIVLLVLHAGLAFSVYGLWGQSWDDASVRAQLIGLTGLYGSFLLGVAFIAVPLYPWIRRAQRLARWRELLLEELPAIIAAIPAFLETLRSLRHAIDEVIAELLGRGGARPPEPPSPSASPKRRPRAAEADAASPAAVETPATALAPAPAGASAAKRSRAVRSRRIRRDDAA